MAGLQAVFRVAVDDGLACCAKLGHTPEKPCKGSFSVCVGYELLLAASIAAMPSAEQPE